MIGVIYLKNTPHFGAEWGIPLEQGAFDGQTWEMLADRNMFQPLWSREGSFDMPVWSLMSVVVICFNPFRTGRGLSTKSLHLQANTEMNFNPFGTWQGLSTMCFKPSLKEF